MFSRFPRSMTELLPVTPVWRRVLRSAVAVALVATVSFWTAAAAHAAGLIQVGDQILGNPIIVSFFALLGNGFVATFVTGALRAGGITFGLKPERLVYWVSLLTAVAINLTVGLPHWVADADPNTFVMAMLTWAKTVQLSAQTLYEALLGRVVPGQDPQPEPRPIG